MGKSFLEEVLQCLFDTCLEADDNALEHGVSGRWDYLKVHLRSCKCCSLFFPERIQKFRLHSVSGNEYISMLCNLRYPQGPQKNMLMLYQGGRKQTNMRGARWVKNH